MSIKDILASLNAAEDDDVAFIVAATINLYITALEKRSTRRHLGPADARKIIEIVGTLLEASEPTNDYKPEHRKAGIEAVEASLAPEQDDGLGNIKAKGDALRELGGRPLAVRR